MWLGLESHLIRRFSGCVSFISRAGSVGRLHVCRAAFLLLLGSIRNTFFAYV